MYLNRDRMSNYRITSSGRTRAKNIQISLRSHTELQSTRELNESGA